MGRLQEIKVAFTSDKIIFTNGYPFKQSSIYKSQEIVATQINEIRINTMPFSVLINNNEIIFLEYNIKTENELEEFAKINSLKIKSPIDIWFLLSNIYLDSEFKSEEKQKMQVNLIECGFTTREIKALRFKLLFTFWINLFLAEWIYLGQYNYLRLTLFLNKKKYWWTMSIALRSPINSL